MKEQEKTRAANTRRLASPWCFYIAGGVFLLWALVLPLYKMTHYLLAALAAAAAYAVSARLLPGQVVEVPQKLPETGDALADSTVAEGRAYLDRLNAVAGRIASAPVRASLRSIDETVEKILAAIADDPAKASMARRLMSYYLPTLIKLTEYYEKLEDQGGAGENVTGAMARIGGNLSQLDLALKKQLDLMYERDALDITTDVTVMENMLAREGLTGGMLEKNAAAPRDAGGAGITLHLYDEEETGGSQVQQTGGNR